MRWLKARGGAPAAGDPEEMLAGADEALEDDRPDDALRAADALLRSLRRGGGDPELRVDALCLRAEALVALGRFADAVRSATEAVELAPDDPAAHHQLAMASYRLAAFEDAAWHYGEAVRLDPDDALSWHGLGRARVWLDDLAGADAALRRAAELDPDHFSVPLRIAAPEFDRIAAEVYASIPPAFQARLRNTMVAVEPLPDIEDVEDGEDPDLLGVYTGGTALDDDGIFERIVLYQRNHEAVCGTLGALREEVRRTILHEVGHHFGMDHDELPY